MGDCEITFTLVMRERTANSDPEHNASAFNG
jgi:hypothetical protein